MAKKPSQQLKAKLNLNLSDRILITGLPKTGKTTLARALAALAVPDLYIIDPLSQYAAFDAFIGAGNRIVPEPGKEIETFEQLCFKLCSVPNKMLLLEECEDYLGQGLMLTPYAYKVVRQGRNWGIGIIGITQRIPEVSKRYFDRCQHIFFFRPGIYSQDYIRERVGREKAAIIFHLSIDQHEFLHYDVGADTGNVYRLVVEGSKLELVEPETSATPSSQTSI